MKDKRVRSKLGMGEIQRRRNAKLLERERAALERQEFLEKERKDGLEKQHLDHERIATLDSARKEEDHEQKQTVETTR